MRNMNPLLAAALSLSVVFLIGAGVQKNSWDASQIVSGTLAGARGGGGAALPTCGGSDVLTANGSTWSCTTPAGGIGGSIADTQVAWGDSTNIGGEAAFTYDDATNQLKLTAGTLADGNEALEITATQPTTIAAAHNAVAVTITSAGSSSQSNRGVDLTYAAGYTGSSATVGFKSTNSAAGTGATSVTGGAANYAGYFLANGNTNGHLVGVYGSSVMGAGGGASSINFGVIGRVTGAAAGAAQIGVEGSGDNTISNSSGGLFWLGGTRADLTDAALTGALVADNVAVARPIFVARDNGTPYLMVHDGGHVGAGPQASTATTYGIHLGGNTATTADTTMGVQNNHATGDAMYLASNGSLEANIWGWGIDNSTTNDDFVLGKGATLGAASTIALQIDGSTRVISVAVGVLGAIPAAQTIAEGNVVAADACGGVKQITSAGAVTTDTTNTFTAPAAGNTGCCMDVINTGANQITLDNNANFYSASAGNVVLGPADTVRVCGNGTYWFQIGATGNN